MQGVGCVPIQGSTVPYTGFNCSKVHKLGRIIPHSEKHPKNAHFSENITDHYRLCRL